MEEEPEELIELEVYSINISKDNKEIIFGGANDTFSILHVESNEEVFTDDFNESIFYVNYFNNEILAVTYHGELNFYTNFTKTTTFSFNEEVSLVKMFDLLIFIGFESGRFIILKEKEVYFDYFINTTNILDVLVHNTYIYVLTSNNLLVYDDNLQEIKRFMTNNSKSFTLFNQIIAVVEENCVSFFSLNRKVNEIRLNEVDCLVELNDFLVLGGNFDYLLILDKNYGMRKIALEVKGVTRMKVFNQWLYFTTTDDKFCYGDFDKFYINESGVGSVFDFDVCNEFYVLGGEKGVTIERINRN